MKMKPILAVLMMGFVFCFGTSFTEPAEYEPILMKRSELVNSVRYIAEGRDLKQPGKIYYKSPYIYINERYKGVHVIDNTDPQLPRKLGFILAPGCIDMAVKDHYLYLDNSVDLVTVDLDTRQVTSRIEAVFPEPAHPNNMRYRFKDKPEDMVVVEWRLVNP